MISLPSSSVGYHVGMLAGAGAAILDDKMEAICEGKKNKRTEGSDVSKILDASTISTLDCLNLNGMRKK